MRRDRQRARSIAKERDLPRLWRERLSKAKQGSETEREGNLSMVNNETRANWAQNAANAFGQETYGGRTFAECGEDGETLISDLVCDLMHLATRHGWDAAKLVDYGIKNFEFEITPGNENA